MVNTDIKLVDAPSTEAWANLQAHYDGLQKEGISLRKWFDADKKRGADFSYKVGPLHIDLSKNLITPKTTALLAQLAKEVGLSEKINDMYSGKHINNTEDRAVLHTALRRPKNKPLTVDGQDVTGDVHKVLDDMYAFAEKVRSGEHKGVTGKKIETIVNIGIGGSDLGPRMVYEALKPYQDGITARYISNIDPDDVTDNLVDLDPETTMIIIASKTFTTLETMTNARVARTWFLNSLAKKGIISSNTDEKATEAISKHFIAVSTALDLVAEFGIDPKNAFGFWNFVGGRYSVDSAVGMSLILVYGAAVFKDFLKGFNEVDEYFEKTDIAKNAVALMGLINIWYCNFFGSHAHGVLPYSQHLHRFTAYLQQMTMESNGKGVKADGTPVTTQTGEIFFGEPGTNGQHAFYQLIHQGTRLIPCDFIGVVNPANPVKDGNQDVHELFLANFLAQTTALAFGKTADEVRAEGVPEELVTAKVFSGNRPTTSIMVSELNSEAVGALIALYEHITFTQGIIWNLDSFDQWGVELGKKLANQIAPAITSDDAALEKLDSSTQNLINFYRNNRK
ncbi:MAG: glucose-6-phosphate isomerase [Bifidobacteriaceae bacterium]|jgi:glucose-6-phosphate isomerase|nr:glucose-6-phosphate isomerase [Bifidobacteriaceae bacterium]